MAANGSNNGSNGNGLRRVRMLLRRKQAIELWSGGRMLCQATVWDLPKGARVTQAFDVPDDVQVRVVDNPAPEMAAGRQVRR